MPLRLRKRMMPTAPGPTAWLEAGHDPPLILIHGVGLRAEVWAGQIDALATSHRVIAYDTLGHGLSGLPPANAGLGDYVAQLVQLMDTLELPCASLAGHSMGAMIAVAAALREPGRFDRLIALNGVYDRSPDERARALERADLLDRGGAPVLGESALERWFGPAAEGAFPSERTQVRRWLKSVDPIGYARAYRVFATSDVDLVGKLDRLACPALFLTGELDPHSTPAMSRAMAAAAPFGHAVVLPSQRHMAAFAAPDLCNPIIRQFLEDGSTLLSPPPAPPPEGEGSK